MLHRSSASDIAFRSEFEAGRVPPAEFDHRAHVRLAYVYLTELDPDAAYQAIRSGLLNFLCRHGIDGSKYHDTLTRAWVLAVRAFMDGSPPCESAEALIRDNPRLHDSKILTAHYSPELLFSNEARARFVEPDRRPIPVSGT
jgi:hypothetical protein